MNRDPAAMIRVLALVVGLAAGLAWGRAAAEDAVSTTAATTRITVETENGARMLAVELARTPAERERGLMFRRSLAPDSGMLFLYEREGQVGMWMKDTFLSLDILFLDREGRIAKITPHTTPLSTRPIPSGVPVKGVLELVAGSAERLGLKLGDRVRHPAFAGGEPPPSGP